MYYDRMDGGGWIVMLIIMILVIAVVALVAWRLLTNLGPTSQGTPPPSPRPSATDLLDERLACGEIDPDEYRERMAALRERDQSG